MKIGFVSPHTFTYPGGVQKHILALKEEFEKRGHSVKLISPREEIPQKKDEDTILLGGALYIPGNASKTNLSLNLTPFSIFQKLRKEKFDILHFQNFGLFLPWQVLESSKKFFKKTINILTFHAFLDASRIFKGMPFLPEIINGYILPKFDGVIVVSKPVLAQLKYSDPCEIIPNGINLDFFNPKGEKIEKFSVNQRINPRQSASIINILFVGRLEKRKGLIYLVRAFEILIKKHQNIRLIIVGEGMEEKRIKDYIKEKRISNIFFEGRIKEDDLPKYYRSADICCFPSLSGEAFGIVLLEAMASGKPVVAFANRGYSEVLVGKGAEFLAEPKDIKGLEKKLEILIKNQNKREEIGKWGRKEAKKYSWDKVAEQTLEFYNKVIKSKQN